jgi:hypothetical protein
LPATDGLVRVQLRANAGNASGALLWLGIRPSDPICFGARTDGGFAGSVQSSLQLAHSLPIPDAELEVTVDLRADVLTAYYNPSDDFACDAVPNVIVARLAPPVGSACAFAKAAVEATGRSERPLRLSRVPVFDTLLRQRRLFPVRLTPSLFRDFLGDGDDRSACAWPYTRPRSMFRQETCSWELRALHRMSLQLLPERVAAIKPHLLHAGLISAGDMLSRCSEPFEGAMRDADHQIEHRIAHFRAEVQEMVDLERHNGMNTQRDDIGAHLRGLYIANAGDAFRATLAWAKYVKDWAGPGRLIRAQVLRTLFEQSEYLLRQQEYLPFPWWLAQAVRLGVDVLVLEYRDPADRYAGRYRELQIPTRTPEQLEEWIDLIASYDVVFSTFIDDLPIMPNQTRYFWPTEQELIVQPSAYHMNLTAVLASHG